MSRSGYCDDIDPRALIRWRGAVSSAIKGRRGQALLMEMRDALDAMPEKRLIAYSLVEANGDVCALGSVALTRGLDVSAVDPDEPEQVAKTFGVSEALVREIAYENDDCHYSASPESRWTYMRRWIDRNIRAEATQ